MTDRFYTFSGVFMKKMLTYKQLVALYTKSAKHVHECSTRLFEEQMGRPVSWGAYKDRKFLAEMLLAQAVWFFEDITGDRPDDCQCSRAEAKLGKYYESMFKDVPAKKGGAK
jgi:hypothetical protein